MQSVVFNLEVGGNGDCGEIIAKGEGGAHVVCNYLTLIL